MNEAQSDESAPPVSTTGNNPNLIRLKAYPIAWADEAQAASIVNRGPLNPNRIDTFEAGALFITIGIFRGLLKLFSMKKLCKIGSRATMHPDAPPKMTPRPKGSH